VRQANIPETLLGNSSVNTFPQQQIDTPTIEVLLETRYFYVVHAEVILKTTEATQSVLYGSLKRELEPGGRKIALVEAVTRKRLVSLRTLDHVL
jgi:hypothetical protein